MTAAPVPARCSSCSGRTREGPEPKRPSAGLSSSGICRAVVVWVMRDSFGGSIALHAQARGGPHLPPLPGGFLHLLAPVTAAERSLAQCHPLTRLAGLSDDAALV